MFIVINLLAISIKRGDCGNKTKIKLKNWKAKVKYAININIAKEKKHLDEVG